MTHLSDNLQYSYLERLGFNLLTLLFFYLYAYRAKHFTQDLSYQKLKHMNFKGLVIVLYICALIAAIISDVIAAYVKYNTGFFDTCKNCTDFAYENGLYQICLSLDSCRGIVTKPREELPEWALNLLPIADFFWNFNCTLRTSALFLMLTCINYAIPRNFSFSFLSNFEIKACAIYAAFSLPIYVFLQYIFFGVDTLLSTVVPQIYYSTELVSAAVFLFFTNYRVSETLENSSRNYDDPTGIEAIFKNLIVLNICLAYLLLLSAFTLAAINIDILIHGSESGPVASSKFWTDLLTRMFNLGNTLEPVFVVFILYMPVLKVLDIASKETEQSFENAASPLAQHAGDIDTKDEGSYIKANQSHSDSNQVLQRAESSYENVFNEELVAQTLQLVEKSARMPAQKSPMLSAKDTSDLLKDDGQASTDQVEEANIEIVANDTACEESEFKAQSASHDTAENSSVVDYKVSTKRGNSSKEDISSANRTTSHAAKEQKRNLLDKTSLGDEDELDELALKDVQEYLSRTSYTDFSPQDEYSSNEEKFWQVSKHMRTIGDIENEPVLTGEERVAIARVWLSDALANREIKLHRLKGAPMKVYKFCISRTWKYMLYLVLFVQVFILPFMEPPSTFRISRSMNASEVDKLYPNYGLALVIDLICCNIFALDIFMLLYTYGPKDLQMFEFSRASLLQSRSKKSKLMHARMLLLLIMFVNVLVALINRTAFRLDRIFRPATLIFISHTVRTLFQDLVLTFLDFLGVLVFYLFSIGWYAIVGAIIFDGDAYNNQRDEDFGISTNTSIWKPEKLYSVGHPPILGLNLYILSSLESYPDVFIPAYATQPIKSSIYFVSFVIFSILFLQSIAVPLVYLPFQRRQRKRILQLKIQERKALVAVFELLDVRREEKLDLVTMKPLLEPFCSNEHIDLMLQILDEDHDGSVDKFEFFKVIDTIKSHVKVSVVKDEVPYWSFKGIRISKTRCKSVLDSFWFQSLSNFACISVLITLFLYNIIHMSVIILAVGLYIIFIAMETFLMHVTATNRMSARVLFKKAVLVVEITLYIMVLGLSTKTTSRDVVLAMLCILLLTVNIGERLVKNVKTVSKIIFVSIKMLHILSIILLVIFFIMYVYIIIGMESFFDSILTTLPSGTNDFSTYWLAWLSVFQMVTGESWHYLLYAQYSESSRLIWHAYVIVYFISFNIFLNIYILSIVLAIFLDAFLVFQDIKEDTISVTYDNDKLVKMLGIPRRKYMLVKHRSLEEVLYQDFLQENNLKTIEELFRRGVISNETDTIIKRKLEMQKRKKRLSRFLSSAKRTKSGDPDKVLRSSEISQVTGQKDALGWIQKDVSTLAALFED